jgi:glycosyltransferase involved in cell wall biosynthesis
LAHDIPSLNAINRKSHKKILVVHDYYTPSLIASGAVRLGGVFERFFRVVEASSYMKADAIIAVDNRIRQYLLYLGIPKLKVFTVLNAPNTRNFQPYPKRRAEFRHEFNLPNDLLVVLVPRRLVKKAGVEYAIRAAEKVYRQNNKFVLVVAGIGHEERRLRRLARAMGIADRVVFLGGVEPEKMWRLYNASDVIVIPSIRVGDVEEASSLSALEAMSCAKPVIASCIGGLVEIIKHRETGFLVAERDPENLSKTIALLLRNERLRTEIGLRARNFVIQHERRIRSHLIHLVERTRTS